MSCDVPAEKVHLQPNAQDFERNVPLYVGELLAWTKGNSQSLYLILSWSNPTISSTDLSFEIPTLKLNFSTFLNDGPLRESEPSSQKNAHVPRLALS